MSTEPRDPTAIMAAPVDYEREAHRLLVENQRLADELGGMQEQAAEAWDEGFKRGCHAEKRGYGQHGFADLRATNPYRAALAGEGAADQPKWTDLFGIAPDFDAEQFGIEGTR